MLDELDLKILKLLQKNGRIKRSEIAENVGLSIPSVSERLYKLEDSGVIEGYYARLNRKALGNDIMAFIIVVMDSSKHFKEFTSKIEKMPQIIECYTVLGEGSHIMKAVVKDSGSLEKLLTVIQSWPGVVRTITSLILSTIKETTVLDIK